MAPVRTHVAPCLQRAASRNTVARIRGRSQTPKTLKHGDLTGVQCEKGLVHGGWQCLTVVGLFCGKQPPGGKKQQVLISVPLPIDH